MKIQRQDAYIHAKDNIKIATLRSNNYPDIRNTVT